ncbi:MAG: hypothetical protein ABEI53_00815, partial [Candidatus Magasanikbacteria bacterium]
GLRKQKEEKGTQKNNKFCFNHFVTPSSYELDPPHNIYWTQLYRNLIPVYGNKEEIRNFFSKNQWAEPRKRSYSQLKEREEGLIMRSLEFSWQSKLGNWLEEALRRYQIYRIKKSLKKGFVGYNPQLNYSGRELRFHMDTRRIENILEKFNEQVNE